MADDPFSNMDWSTGGDSSSVNQAPVGVYGGGATDTSGGSTDSGMPSWAGSLIGAAGSVGTAYFNNQTAQTLGVASLQAQTAQAQAQAAYMSSFGSASAFLSNANNRKYLYIFAGVMVFWIMLRQTAQA